MKIDFFVNNHRHFIDHLSPIWHCLPHDVRGQFLVPRDLRSWAESRGIMPTTWRRDGRKLRLLKESQNVLVANSYADLGYAKRANRPGILVDHGNGQSFGTDSPHHAGGRGRNREYAILYVMPNWHAANRNVAKWPEIPNAVVGCPKLDHWHNRDPKPRSDPPVVALTFHWNAIAEEPEKRWAWEHYARVLPQLVAAHERGEFRLIGHGHPRVWNVLARQYERLGIEAVIDLEDVFAQTDLYINDSSSTLFEFASLDRPVVVLNAPWYRRDVELGIRFWEAAHVGVNVNEPHELLGAVHAALLDPPEQQAARRDAVRHAYAFTDGRASLRAAEAIGIAAQHWEQTQQKLDVHYFTHMWETPDALNYVPQSVRLAG